MATTVVQVLNVAVKQGFNCCTDYCKAIATMLDLAKALSDEGFQMFSPCAPKCV
jgi:hypothetical protein